MGSLLDLWPVSLPGASLELLTYNNLPLWLRELKAEAKVGLCGKSCIYKTVYEDTTALALQKICTYMSVDLFHYTMTPSSVIKIS